MMHRPWHRMKPRTQFLIVLGMLMLILGIAWLTYPGRRLQPKPILSATIHRDCAPWDGAAFSVSIPMENGTVVEISIWKSPDIKFPVHYSFPDRTSTVGNAVLLASTGEVQQLSGDVRFSGVEEGQAVEGEFRLQSESGKLIEGNFSAEWGDLVASCG